MDREELKQGVKKARKELHRAQLIMGIGAVLGFVFVVPRLFRLDSATFILMPLMIFLYVGLLLLIYRFYVKPKHDEYQLRVKDVAYKLVFREEFSDVQYDPKRGVDRELMKDTRLIHVGSEYYSNDYMKGSYKGVDFVRADVLSQTTTHNSADNSSSTTVHFKGQVYRFDFHKNVTRSLWLRDRGFMDRLFGSWGNPGSVVNFEDDEFNRMFTVRALDEQEAFYVFTPKFMEKVRILRYQVDCQMSWALVNQYFYMALYTKRDAFELSSFRDLDDRYLDDVRRDVRIIKYIIDDLGLDSTLFKE